MEPGENNATDNNPGIRKRLLNSFNLILENLKQSAVFKQFKEDTIGEGVTNQDGKITFKYTNGSQYTGLWKDGKPHGKGIYTWADGNTYDGEWNDGKLGWQRHYDLQKRRYI